MQETDDRVPRRGELILGCALFAAIGIAAMAFLNWPALGVPSSYHGDLTQSPHWLAYHGDKLDRADLLLEYATYNETPLQNGIYWVGTLFLDAVPLNKLVGILLFGLTTALCFGLVSGMWGLRAGLLAASFLAIFPRGAYEIAGGFSKAWAIGLVLAAVYVVETRSWRVLPWLMPFAAVAYPVTPVLIGAIVLTALVLDWPRAAADRARSWAQLILGSALALVPLLYKYFTPPDRIGEMISTRALKAVWERGDSEDAAISLWAEVLSYLGHPFFVYGTVLLLILLHRRGLVWKRSWTALVLASGIAYLVAELFVPRLYLPDRYTRYSVAVMLVLWHACNWSRVLGLLPSLWARRAAMAALLGATILLFSDTFRPGDGGDLNRWDDESQFVAISRFLAQEPDPVLVAGHPYTLGDVMVQSRRPVLVIHRMFHLWFSEYSAEIDRRNRDILQALYARNVDQVDALAARYGVTHLIVTKSGYNPRRLRAGKIYKPQYDGYIAQLARGGLDFVLLPPPAEAVVFEDELFWLVRLPLLQVPDQGM